MNKTMRHDVNTALRQRISGVLGDFAQRLTNSAVNAEPDTDLSAENAQLEADTDRLFQMFKFMRRDRFDEAYNMLDLVGQPPDVVPEVPAETPVEPAPTEPVTETPPTGA
jgi:hypothetical protein